MILVSRTDVHIAQPALYNLESEDTVRGGLVVLVGELLVDHAAACPVDN